MSAMGDLRLSLLEHGVNYDEYGDGYTHWTHDGVNYTAQQNIVGKLIVCNLTPEQAIEATLGRGECHDKNGGCSDEYTHGFECTVCEATTDSYMHSTTSDEDEPFNFCPNCGRKVKQ